MSPLAPRRQARKSWHYCELRLGAGPSCGRAGSEGGVPRAHGQWSWCGQAGAAAGAPSRAGEQADREADDSRPCALYTRCIDAEQAAGTH